MSPGFDRLDPEDEELLRVAVRAARRAARVHRRRSPAEDGEEWREKSRSDFVTEVDLEAQEAVVETLEAAFPDHRIVAEEEPGEEPEEDGPAAGAADDGGSGGGEGAAGGSSVRWIVDPLDGTTNWLHGYPEYAASLAAEDDRGLRVGVVLNSATGERFEAVRDAGSRVFPPGPGGSSEGGGVPVRVSAVSRLELALVGTGFPFKKLEFMAPYLEVFHRVLSRTSGIRRAGSAALDLCHLASGRLDAFWEMWLMPWDVAAGALVLREAGGILETLPLPDDALDDVSDDAPDDAPDAPADGSLPGSFAHRRPAGYLGANPSLMPAFRALVLGEGGGSAGGGGPRSGGAEPRSGSGGAGGGGSGAPAGAAGTSP